ncbi:hypothetical protein [Gallaecimonas sp. GXIMD4217]|uniref:hypothetical protein n=1 Tax=Gallaecimonas sp. GXIMD4217 TaxID=3131927 RepID=UPI00311AC0AD
MRPALLLLSLLLSPMLLAHDRASAEDMLSRLKPVPSSLEKLDWRPGDPQPPRYRLKACEGAVCCEYERIESGASCNLFKLLCRAAGGKASGDGEKARCEDWH